MGDDGRRAPTNGRSFPVAARCIASAIAAAALAVAGAPSVAATQVRVDAFLALSERLTGHSSLSADVAKTLLEAIHASAGGTELEALVDGTLADDGALANRIVGDWYSGVAVAGDGKDVVATYEGALMWKALTFTKPMGVCGGATGYWQDPPRSRG
ncbi:MAG: sugar dehydrogenase complex small subunit [Pseudomonadota bacterium]